MRRFPVCVWMVLTSLLAIVLASVSAAPRRAALVIGNAAYQEGPLRNPVNDATDMAATLRQLGFVVTLVRDATLPQMEEALTAFSRQLRKGGMGLFYFAGHGVRVNGENYLLPLGVRFDREQDVRYKALPAGQVLGAMEDADNGLNVIILDACRNNPFARSWRSSRRGLAVTQAFDGSLIAYATAPGSVAADGEGRNGLYTHHLMRAMQTPGLSVERMFKQVRVAVRKDSGGKQTPWESSSLIGDFTFKTAALTVSPPQPVPPKSPVVSPALSLEVELWEMVKDSPSAKDLKFFLETYPEGRFVPHARLKLNQLERQQHQASLPSPPSVESPQPVKADEQPLNTPGQQQETPRFEAEQRPQEAPRQRVEDVPQVSSTQVRQAQKQLQLAGLNPGPADGQFGPRTADALRQYQVQQGLSVTGRLDHITRQSLSAQAQQGRTQQRLAEELHRVERDRQRLLAQLAQQQQGAEPPQRAVEAESMPVQRPTQQVARLDPEAQNVARYIRQLRSPDSLQQRKAAKSVYRSPYRRHPKILETVNEELLQGYNTKTRNRHHIDAMAWLCNILGTSGNQTYATTLDKVANETRSGKLKKYALKNYKKLQ